MLGAFPLVPGAFPLVPGAFPLALPGIDLQCIFQVVQRILPAVQAPQCLGATSEGLEVRVFALPWRQIWGSPT